MIKISNKKPYMIPRIQVKCFVKGEMLAGLNEGSNLFVEGVIESSDEIAAKNGGRFSEELSDDNWGFTEYRLWE